MNTSQAIERMRQVLRRQHKALSTEEAYVFWLCRYMKALPNMPVQLSSEKKFELFLTQLARNAVSASSQNQAFNAILYFYREVMQKPIGRINALRAKRPVHERHAPTVTETQLLLNTIRNEGGYPTNLISRLLYGCGLRVTEPLNLRIKDVDLERRTLCIRGAKGGNDRVVALPNCLIPELTQQMQVAKAVWQRDKQNGTPLMLPNLLAKKYPEYQFSWGWAWLFPAHQPCRDPRSGMIVRYRMHEVNVQRAVKYARRKLGISVLPHELRHGYATDCLQRGASPRAIQQAMGHKSLETTMGYLHAEALSVSSPLDALPLILPVLERKPACVEALPAIARDVQKDDRSVARPVVKRPDSMTPKPLAATTMQMGPVIHRAGLQPKTVKTVRTLEATQSSHRGRTPTAQKGPAPLSWSLCMKATSGPPGSLQCAPSLNQTPKFPNLRPHEAPLVLDHWINLCFKPTCRASYKQGQQVARSKPKRPAGLIRSATTLKRQNRARSTPTPSPSPRSPSSPISIHVSKNQSSPLSKAQTYVTTRPNTNSLPKHTA